MSAYRVPGPDGRIVLVPADDGMTPYRHGTYIGGSLVTERKAAPLPVPATNEATRARMAAYKARRKTECGREFTGRHVGRCARVRGHAGDCMSAANLKAKADRQRAHGPAFSIHPEHRR